MKKRLMLILLVLASLSVRAQEPLSLPRCRELALRNNKQLMVARLSRDIAEDHQQVAKHRSLPRVEGLAGAEFYSREISILNKDQKAALGNLGTNMSTQLGSHLSSTLEALMQQGIVTPQAAQQIGTMAQSLSQPLAQAGDDIGSTIRDAFRTNTKSIWAGGVVVTQPVYMGGSITAANEMARISQEMAQNTIDNTLQNTLYAIDNAYWLAVSLKNKEQLARQFLALLQKLNNDVGAMIREGVATRADGLKVDVAVNNAEMQLTQVEDGVALAKMYLCQLCGLPLNGQLVLADEGRDDWLLDSDATLLTPTDSTYYYNRPEMRLLQNAVDMSRQNTKLTQALYKPHVALTGGVTVSNPNTFNGFERRFKDLWNIGIVVQMPLWNWHEGRYKTHATQIATTIAQLEMDDVKEKIALQVEQGQFRLKEAHKRLLSATRNMASAEENLRCANVGYREGVMTVTDVMEAQTAWQQAQSHRIDAQIDVKLSQLALQKALGTLIP